LVLNRMQKLFKLLEKIYLIVSKITK